MSRSTSKLFLAAIACLTLTRHADGKRRTRSVVIGDLEVDMRRNAVANSLMTWPNGIVHYHMSSTLDYGTRTKILDAMKAIEDSVNGPGGNCIKFVTRTWQHNYIDVYKGTGCHSSVGLLNWGRQGVSIGTGCEFKGIIMHELVHTLGFYHEHNRYDRDENVVIDFNNILPNNDENFELKGPHELDLLGTPYDMDSIMSYDPYTLASDTSRPVITPQPGKSGDVFRMGQRMSLSRNDVLKIQKLYGCPEDATHIVQPEIDNSFLTCNFHPDTCGMVDGSGDVSWSLRSGPSPAGPHNGHSFGNDNYLVATAGGNSGKTAKIHTPESDRGSCCIDFYLFLKDSTSTLKLEVFGPAFLTTELPIQASSTGYNQWVRYQSYIQLPPGFAFQITFKAVLGSADVAIDDLQIYTGECN